MIKKQDYRCLLSLPSRKCGLKYICHSRSQPVYTVTSLAEVWIEIESALREQAWLRVTSLAEVWIEIPSLWTSRHLPFVTSLAEVWIEIALSLTSTGVPSCHFPRGSVD